VFHNFFFRKSCRLWDNVEKVVERGRSQMTIWRMRVAGWIPKATNTHSQYVIFIAFPLQQWLHDRASFLRYTYNACLVFLQVISVVIVQWLMVQCFRVWSSVSWVYCLEILAHFPLSLSNSYKCLRKFTPIFLGAYAKLRKVTYLHALPPARNNSDPTRRIFMKFDICMFF
jgi:hypothetical protein